MYLCECVYPGLVFVCLVFFFISLWPQPVNLHSLVLALEIIASGNIKGSHTACNSHVFLNFVSYNSHVLMWRLAEQCPLDRQCVTASPCQIALNSPACVQCQVSVRLCYTVGLLCGSKTVHKQQHCVKCVLYVRA